MENKKFKAKLSARAKFLTVVGLAILTFTLLTHFGVVEVENKPSPLAENIILCVLIGVFLFAFLYRPLAYGINDGFVTVYRPIANANYKIPEIATIQKIPFSDLILGLRLLGSGGFFGFFGYFYSKNHGMYTSHVTDYDKLLLITFKKGKKVVISPEKRDEFAMLFESESQNK